MNRHFSKTELKRFSTWIGTNGGEVLATTNPWEVLRFQGNGQVSIIYKKRNGDLTFTGESMKAVQAWRTAKPYRFCMAIKLRKRSVDEATLIERDGPDCFYCGEEFTDKNPPTIEHLVSRTHGGPNHISNKYLAHQRCNTKAGNLSAPEKLRIRDRLRANNLRPLKPIASREAYLDQITREMREIL